MVAGAQETKNKQQKKLRVIMMMKTHLVAMTADFQPAPFPHSPGPLWSFWGVKDHLTERLLGTQHPYCVTA